jgi:pimeloyl-ACP methyl ester carboxylesterase
MRLLWGVTATAASALAWSGSVRAYYHRAPAGDEVRFTTTNDGWRLALTRYRALGARHRLPVILCHGLAANRFAFDLGPEASLARYLAARGFDTWVLELRGHGQSDRPGHDGRRWGWSLDDYLLRDVPAAIAAVREWTDAPRVGWIGHSMGGILLYAHLAREAPGDGGIAAGVVVGSSLDYDGSASEFFAVRRLEPLARVLPVVPLGALATVTAAGAGRLRNRVERFNYWEPNLDPVLARRLNAVGFHAVSGPVLVQLSSAFEPGGLRGDGGRGAAFTPGLAESPVPVLSVAGTQDRQCPPPAAARTIAAMRMAPSEARAYGRAQGHPTEYGHFDLLLGPRAREEVFVDIERHLARGQERVV